MVDGKARRTSVMFPAWPPLAALAVLLAVPAACSSGSHGGDAGGSDARDAAGETSVDVAVEQGDDVPAADGGEPDGGDAATEDASEAGDAPEQTDAGNDGADAPPSADGGDAAGDGRPSDASGDAPDGSTDGQPACTTCGLYPQFQFQGAYIMGGFGPTTFRIEFGIDVINGGNQRVSLAGVSVRYWFTGNGLQWDAVCFAGPCGMGRSTLFDVSPVRSGTDRYLEFAFTGGSLDAFSNTGQIEQWIETPQNPFNPQEPDPTQAYSFTPNQAVPNPKITIYVGGKLVWGVEPPP
jgi:hypothetical protein